MFVIIIILIHLFSEDLDEYEYSSMKAEDEIPVHLWAEHFSMPLKRRNKYMMSLFDKNFVQTKRKYVYLDDSQIMGKTLDKFGIPNVFGKVCK